MMTETAAGLRDVTVSSAEVTIRVLHVANKPMTIAVYNQLPFRDQGLMATLETSRSVGWINRCHQRCPQICQQQQAKHVLVVSEGEPSLVRMIPTHLELMAKARHIRHQELLGHDFELGQLERRDGGWRWPPGSTILEAARYEAHILEVEAGTVQEWWTERIDSLPQLYVAR